MNFSGATAYDIVFPNALLRVTFVKAHWYQSADAFYTASQDVYNNLSMVAHVYPTQQFPLVSGDTQWTVDVRSTGTQERPLSVIANELQAACDATGVDLVAPDTIQVLNATQVKNSTGIVGSTERAMASADASQRAASNPGTALGNAATGVGDIGKSIADALSGVGRWVIIVLVLAIIGYVLLTRKK